MTSIAKMDGSAHPRPAKASRSDALMVAVGFSPRGRSGLERASRQRRPKGLERRDVEGSFWPAADSGVADATQPTLWRSASRGLKPTATFGAWLRHALPVFAILALLLATILPGSAQPTNGPVRPDYSAFQIITERNIFNQHRYARSVRQSRRETQPTVREAFTLVGTMSYEKGPFAFFEGTRSEYRKVLQADGAIAGYKVASIQPAYVKLASATNEVQLPVGMQMRRDDEGGWQMAASELPPSSPTPSTSSYVRPAATTNLAQTAAAPGATNGEPQVVVIDPITQTIVADSQADNSMTNTAPAGAAAGSDDPVLLRLMRQREQQLNQ